MIKSIGGFYNYETGSYEYPYIAANKKLIDTVVINGVEFDIFEEDKGVTSAPRFFRTIVARPGRA